MSEHLKAPFKQEAVVQLNRYQNYSGWHPFTCGNNRGDEAHKAYTTIHGGDWGQLIATSAGWVCPVCGYTQDWAHEFMSHDIPELPNIFATQGLKGHPKPRLERPFEPLKGLKPAQLQYAIYEKPADYPEHFVVRQWEIYAQFRHGDEREAMRLVVPGVHRIAPTLEMARDLIPDRITRILMPRAETDDACIVETWI